MVVCPAGVVMISGGEDGAEVVDVVVWTRAGVVATMGGETTVVGVVEASVAAVFSTPGVGDGDRDVMLPMKRLKMRFVDGCRRGTRVVRETHGEHKVGSETTFY
jgi:hypothetical protein